MGYEISPVQERRLLREMAYRVKEIEVRGRVAQGQSRGIKQRIDSDPKKVAVVCVGSKGVEDASCLVGKDKG